MTSCQLLGWLPYMRDLQFSQTCLKGSPEGTYENMLLKTGDLLMQVHLH